jgi:histidine triad (HIT) family protein
MEVPVADCLFCKIAGGEIPSNKIYEDDEMVAFYDINPAAPVHFLVVPKRHIANIMEAGEADTPLLGRLLARAATVARSLGLAEKGARFVINCKEDGGQTVNHVHIHVLGKRAMGWPPG